MCVCIHSSSPETSKEGFQRRCTEIGPLDELILRRFEGVVGWLHTIGCDVCIDLPMLCGNLSFGVLRVGVGHSCTDIHTGKQWGLGHCSHSVWIACACCVVVCWLPGCILAQETRWKPWNMVILKMGKPGEGYMAPQVATMPAF